MKRFLTLLTSLTLLAACQSAKDQPIKIGLITPLTGEVASLGVDILHGAQMKVAEINAAGGIDGRMIELVAEDGRCSGADAASAAQKLINIDKVVAIHGAGCSSETMAAAPIAEAAGIILMSPSSTSPDVTDSGDFIFRTAPNDALKTSAMANYFAEQGFEKVAILSENTDFCQGFATALKADMGEEKIVFEEVVEPGTKDYRTVITRLSEVEFDVIVTNPQTPPNGALILQQLREQGLNQLAIGHDVLDASAVLEIAGEAAEGLQVINMQSMASDTEFGQKFLAEYGEPQALLTWGAYGYDTLGVLADAIAEAGTEGAAMRDYLYNLEGYNGLVGTLSFDDTGDVEGIVYALKEVQDGKFVTIADIAVN